MADTKTTTKKTTKSKSKSTSKTKSTTSKKSSAEKNVKVVAKEPNIELSAKYLKDRFLDHIAENKRRPSSIHMFMKYLGLPNKEFYNFYSSLSRLENDIWKDILTKTLRRLEADPAYAEFVAQEKLLAFYFTLMEELTPLRSYVIYASGPFGTYTVASSHLDAFRELFLEYATGVIQIGIQTEEVYERPYITSKYNLGLWTQMLFVLNFWVKDESTDMQKTDEAIEKVVDLSFDLMGKTPLDTLMDFGQFVIKNRFL